MKKKSSKAKEEQIQTKEVGIFDDFLIIEKDTFTYKLKNNDEWLVFDKVPNNKKKSRFSYLFKEIEKEDNTKEIKQTEENEKSINKNDSLNNSSSLNLSLQTTLHSSNADSKLFEGINKNDSLLDNVIIDNKNIIEFSNTNEEAVELNLDINKVISLEDKRTTVMIKNIPNKFKQDLLLRIIDQNFKGTYDLFILPTDANKFKNFGYCFINFTSSYYIPYFYFMFNGKMWSSTNSKKVCELTYSKVQGKINLLTHYPIKIVYCNEEALNVTAEQQYIIPNVYKLVFNKCFPKEKIDEKKFYFITKMPCLQ